MDYIIKIYKDWKLHSEFTEIIPDMDDDYMFNEKQSIRESARSLKKYGSTCNHVRNNEILIRHEVDKADTLQGIALKYGCTTEQIRRANRLFTSDSLFLRQYLLIPVEKSSPYYPKDDRPRSLPPRAFSTAGVLTTTNNDEQKNEESSQGNHHHNSNNNDTTTRKNISNTSSNNSKSLDSVALSPDEENKKSLCEFLGKIDSTIAESKKYVEKSQHNNKSLIYSQSDDDIFSSGDDKGRFYSSTSSSSGYQTSSYSTSSHHRHSSSGSTADTAQLLNITQGRRVQHSLQKLEKQQDEFFEL